MNSVALAVLSIALLGASHPALASLLWQWSFSGPGVTASGTFTTDELPDRHGLYRMTGITGMVSGGTITALQATDTAIPGNPGYPVDNLVRSAPPQLTTHGFGFAVSNSDYHNPFYSTRYRDYISTPPHIDGAGKEPVIRFKAILVHSPAKQSQ